MLVQIQDLQLLPSKMEVRFEAFKLRRRSECELTKEERPNHVASREGVANILPVA